jgi:hypothetical protein
MLVRSIVAFDLLFFQHRLAIRETRFAPNLLTAPVHLPILSPSVTQ